MIFYEEMSQSCFGQRILTELEKEFFLQKTISIYSQIRIELSPYWKRLQRDKESRIDKEKGDAVKQIGI